MSGPFQQGKDILWSEPGKPEKLLPGLFPLSVISGVGELNMEGANRKTAESVSSPSSADTPYPDCPYLLLDVRDRDQYDRCHIIGGGWWQHPLCPIKPFSISDPFLCLSHSSQFSHRHAVSNYESLHQGSAGICILKKQTCIFISYFIFFSMLWCISIWHLNRVCRKMLWGKSSSSTMTMRE